MTRRGREPLTAAALRPPQAGTARTRAAGGWRRRAALGAGVGAPIVAVIAIVAAFSGGGGGGNDDPTVNPGNTTTTATTATTPTTTGATTAGRVEPVIAPLPTEATLRVAIDRDDRDPIDVLAVRERATVNSPLLVDLPNGTAGITRTGDDENNFTPVRVVTNDGRVIEGFMSAEHLQPATGIEVADRASILSPGMHFDSAERGSDAGSPFEVIVAHEIDTAGRPAEQAYFFYGGHLLGVDGAPSRNILRITIDDTTAELEYQLFEGEGTGQAAGTATVTFIVEGASIRPQQALPLIDPLMVIELEEDDPGQFPASAELHR